MAAAFDVSESEMDSDTPFNILQVYKNSGNKMYSSTGQVCCDQKYVENLAVVYICHLKLRLSFNIESYQTAFQTSYPFKPGGILTTSKTCGNISYDASIPNCWLIHYVWCCFLPQCGAVVFSSVKLVTELK